MKTSPQNTMQINLSCETKKTANRLSIILAFITLLILLTASIWLYIKQKQPSFIPPGFDTSALQGTPEDLAEDFQYIELADNYSVGLINNPYIENNELHLYFTNSADNHYWNMVLLLNSSGAEVGKSGVLKPGEYVSSIALKSENELALQNIIIKIITYEPETYESRGTVTLNPQIYIK